MVIEPRESHSKIKKKKKTKEECTTMVKSSTLHLLNSENETEKMVRYIYKFSALTTGWASVEVQQCEERGLLLNSGTLVSR